MVELQVGWNEIVAGGDSCDIQTDEMAKLDVDTDGCLGVGDFAAVSRLAEPAAAAVSSAAAPATSGTSFVVDVTHDNVDNQLLDGLCITTAGGCSLRAAIQQANATAGPNRIEFDIPGSGPHIITIADRLTTISDTSGPLVIDGFSQPGASANTDPIASNAVHQIAITPSNYVDEHAAFTISSDNNVIRGLSIYDSFYPFLLIGTGATDNHIVGNLIGTNPAVTFSKNPGFSNAAGVQLDMGASFNRIGTPDIADRNVFIGNRSWGIRIEQNETINNYVQNNIFGLKPDGSARFSQHGGIDIQYGTRDNIVGGRALREHNVFSGLVYSAIDFSHNSFNNKAIGNLIGTDLTGTQEMTGTNNQYGLLIKDDARLNLYEDNVVVGSRNENVYNKHNYTGGNTFRNNWIGITRDGTAAGSGRGQFSCAVTTMFPSATSSPTAPRTASRSTRATTRVRTTMRQPTAIASRRTASSATTAWPSTSCRMASTPTTPTTSTRERKAC